VTGKLKVDLSGAPQTMLATFYAKALDAELEKPILGDRWAKDIVDRIEGAPAKARRRLRSILPAERALLVGPAGGSW